MGAVNRLSGLVRWHFRWRRAFEAPKPTPITIHTTKGNNE